MAERQWVRGCQAKDLKPGTLVRCADPRCMARIKEAKPLPESLIERSLEGGDPQPAIFLRFLYMDGAKRGELGDCLLHPEDKVQLAT